MSGKKKTILVSVISLLVIVLAVWLVFKYTKAGEKIKDLFNPDFRVEYDGKDYDGENNIIALPTSGQAQFIIKRAQSYKVTLTPNVTPETDFTYEIDNMVYTFGQVDLSKVFISTDSIKNGDFYLNCVADYSIESVLSQIHNGATITLNGSVQYPYLLTFTADNKVISFAISTIPLISVSESNIIF